MPDTHDTSGGEESQLEERLRQAGPQMAECLLDVCFLQFHQWPLSQEDQQMPYVKNVLGPLMPLLDEVFSRRHGGDARPMRQVTHEERAAIAQMGSGDSDRPRTGLRRFLPTRRPQSKAPWEV